MKLRSRLLKHNLNQIEAQRWERLSKMTPKSEIKHQNPEVCRYFLEQKLENELATSLVKFNRKVEIIEFTSGNSKKSTKLDELSIVASDLKKEY
jgi:hypothetical protein